MRAFTASIVVCALMPLAGSAGTVDANMIVAGMTETLESVSSAQTIVQARRQYDPTYFDAVIADATKGADHGTFVPAPTDLEYRAWSEGNKFRLEVYSLASDPQGQEMAELVSVYMSDGERGGWYTYALPEGVTGGIGEITTCQATLEFLHGIRWFSFYCPVGTRSLEDFLLSEVQPSMAAPERTPATEEEGTYALEWQGSSGITTTVVAPAKGFLPIVSQHRGAGDKLVYEEISENIQAYDGVYLPALKHSKRYDNGKVVAQSSIEVIQASFNQDVTDTVFAIHFPDDIRVRQAL